MSTHMYSKELFSIQSHKNLESHRWVGRQEVFQFLYYCYHVWLSCNIIRCGLLAGHKFVSHTQGKKKTKNIEKLLSNLFQYSFIHSFNLFQVCAIVPRYNKSGDSILHHFLPRS